MCISKAQGQSVSFIPDGGRCRANYDCCRPVRKYGPDLRPDYSACRRRCSRVGGSYGYGACVSDRDVYCNYNKQDRKRCSPFTGGSLGNLNSGYRPGFYNNFGKLDRSDADT